MRPLLSALGALLLLAGCDASDLTDQERAGLQADDAQIALGETASLGGLAVTFDAVLSDSRCPLNALCIWVGEASVALTVGGESVALQVVDPAAAPEAGRRVGDVVLYAVALAPYPEFDEPSDETPIVSITAIAAED